MSTLDIKGIRKSLNEDISLSYEIQEVINDLEISKDPDIDIKEYEGVSVDDLSLMDYGDDILDALWQRISDSVLAIDVYTVKQVVLGVGGPTVYYEITLDEEGNAIKGKYVHTGFTPNEIELDNDQLETVCERYMIGRYYE